MPHVDAELLVTSEPSLPRRAVLFSTAIALLTLALAAWMSWNRSTTPLGFEVGSDQFGLFVRPPRDFRPGDSVQARRRTILPFFGKSPSGKEITLLIIRSPLVEGETSLDFCRQLLSDFGTFRFWKSETEDVLPTQAPLGTVPAIQTIDSYKRFVVRAAEQPTGMAYAAVMIVGDGTLDESLLDLFELVCRSVRFAT